VASVHRRFFPVRRGWFVIQSDGVRVRSLRLLLPSEAFIRTWLIPVTIFFFMNPLRASTASSPLRVHNERVDDVPAFRLACTRLLMPLPFYVANKSYVLCSTYLRSPFSAAAESFPRSAFFLSATTPGRKPEVPRVPLSCRPSDDFDEALQRRPSGGAYRIVLGHFL